MCVCVCVCVCVCECARVLLYTNISFQTKKCEHLLICRTKVIMRYAVRSKVKIKSMTLKNRIANNVYKEIVRS